MCVGIYVWIITEEMQGINYIKKESVILAYLVVNIYALFVTSAEII